MSAEFQHDCPHCHTKKAGFRLLAQWRSNIDNSFANVVAICRVCSGGLLLLSRDEQSATHEDVTQRVSAYPGSRFLIVQTWPEVSSHRLSDIPENVAHFYDQAMENMGAQRWDASGAMFRKALDVATKMIDPDLRSLPLFKRIEKMVSSSLLTPSMGEWAHEIRLDGNDAVHDENPETQSDATSMQKFTEAFLTYTFTLPRLVKKNRAKRAN